jgi:two-component system LytT family response regulator
MNLRVVVVEDQPLARERLVTLLNEDPHVEVVAACENGGEAVDRIRELRPDIVFLDVQMPEVDGFDVIEAVGIDEMPPVVFVTAFDAYALKAFEVHAFDYLLKPFGQARLAAVLARARTQLSRRPAAPPHGHQNDAAARRMTGLLESSAIAQSRERLVFRSAGRILFVRREDIEWVEASGNNALVHATAGALQIRESMRAIEHRLGPGFARVHRSALVNLQRVQEMQVAGGGEYDVLMQSGLKLRVTRLHRAALERKLRELG